MPGRPRKKLDANLLWDAMDPSRKISMRRLARALGVHRNTLKSYLNEYGIGTEFSQLDDTDLDQIIRDFRTQYPQSGWRYVSSHLRRRGLRVQKERVRVAMTRVDKLAHTLQRQRRVAIQRRDYSVPRPNALWHIDGHHKLIHWGIVIHGVVDGYSRAVRYFSCQYDFSLMFFFSKVTGIQASSNNRASTVLEMFLKAVIKFGLPSRVRGDRGGENKDVSVFMILVRGLNRASFMWGSSTSNTRIERLWVEVGVQFARPWKAFFLRLERLHHLDRENAAHLWLLHFLFLDTINDDCKLFQSHWNSHPISGKGHDQTPNVHFLKFLISADHSRTIGSSFPWTS